MIDHRALQADFVDFLGELVNFLVGGVPKKKRDVTIRTDANYFLTSVFNSPSSFKL
jgi:hypothetical protein